jgi:6-phosphogluconolactonase
MASTSVETFIWKDSESLSLAAAHFFVKACAEAVAARGRFIVGLSGGSTPRRLYQLLATPEFSRNIPWKKVFLCWSDERFVPHTDADSNFRMTREALLDHVPIPKANILAIPTKGKPEACAAKYEERLRKLLGSSSPAFDWMLLGMGADGHTASLFPHTSILHEKKKWVSAVWVEEKQTHRISFTYPLINRSREAIFLVAGKEKQPVIATIRGRAKHTPYPVEGVIPTKGKITWMLDDAAAGN